MHIGHVLSQNVGRQIQMQMQMVIKDNGQLMGTFEELQESGCINTGCGIREEEYDATFWIPMFEACMEMTQRNPCPDCPVFFKGKCETYVKYHTKPKIVKSPYG